MMKNINQILSQIIRVIKMHTFENKLHPVKVPSNIGWRPFM